MAFLARFPGVLFLLAAAAGLGFASDVLQIRGGYFWNPQTQSYFIPRGLAYQTWNPPVGANQSFAQLEYDFTEFKKLGATSVRAEFVWGAVETANGQYDWSKPEFMVALAEKLDLKLFIIVGFQYPPSWFPKEYYGINSEGLTPQLLECLSTNPPAARMKCMPLNMQRCLTTNLSTALRSKVLECFTSTNVSEVLSCISGLLPPETLQTILPCFLSDVLNFEHPQARELYRRYIQTLTSHFRDVPSIGGWILGNEYAYFDLWEPPTIFPVHRFLGYDAVSQAAFRSYLQELYKNDIASLNQRWKTAYPGFSDVVMPLRYPSDRHSPAYYDLSQWRKASIAGLVAVGAQAAQAGDPSHLRTYSMVGGIFNPNDANYTAEDPRAIVDRCQSAGAPLHFWSINNYAQTFRGSDLRSGDYGIAKYQELSGLPVMISETGHSSTENVMDPDSPARQPKAVPGQLWESLISGAIGTHLFHWNDRSQFSGDFYRERGFGIVNDDRTPKQPVYDNVAGMLRRMETVKIEKLLGGSSNPPTDVLFFWSTNADLVWPRANQENAMIWGALKRLGYQPGILDDAGLARGEFTRGRALLLSRAGYMDPKDLQTIETHVLGGGIHLHANADLPGQFDSGGDLNPAWAAAMGRIFGFNAAGARAFWSSGVTSALSSELRFIAGPNPLPGSSLTRSITTWQIWQNLTATDALVPVFHSGYQGNAPRTPALLLKSHPAARAAINTFALGEISVPAPIPREVTWDIRSAWLRAVYRDSFGLTPAIELTGLGAAYVVPDYRICRNGSILISLLNEHTNRATVTISAPALLQGKTVETITGGAILAANSPGTVTVALEGDDYVLLYAYSSAAGPSLIDPGSSRVWLLDAPASVAPRLQPYSLSIAYDTGGRPLTLRAALQIEGPNGRVLAQTEAPIPTLGRGTNQLQILLPDPDLNDSSYASSLNGGVYAWHVWLEDQGTRLSELTLPVRVAWAVRPVSIPGKVIAGNSYPVTLIWEELPSSDPADPTPLARADLWDSLHATAEYYNLVLKLVERASGRTIIAQNFLTRSGTGKHTFDVEVPAGASGPFAWEAEIQPVESLVSHDVSDSFEGRLPGSLSAQRKINGAAPSPLLPWIVYNYPTNGAQEWFDEGVHPDASEGSQAAFLVVDNPPPPLGYSGFGLSYVFPEDWSLPTESGKRANFSFSYDFKEKHGHECILEMQIKNFDPNGTGKWLQFTKKYEPRPNGWDTIRATLDKFERPPNTFVSFNPDKIHEIVVNIRMIATDVVYEASIDRIEFNGPDRLVTAGPVWSVYESANDTLRMTIEVGADGLPIVRWNSGAVLQNADEPAGPWRDLLEATSPRTITPSRSKKFFRLRLP